MRRRRTILSIVIALALACIIVAGHKLSARWRSADATVLPRSPCDPSARECTIALPIGGQLSLSIEPRPVRALEKLALTVKVAGLHARQIEIDFDGANMSMGYNRPVLEGSNGVFSGQTILPVCVTGTMTWKATVLVTTEQGRFAAPFQFEVAGR